MTRAARFLAIACLLLLAPGRPAAAAEARALLAVILAHDQTKTLAEIQAALTKNRFYEVFPPEGSAIVDWTVVMGLGQIVMVDAPADGVEPLKRELALAALGAFDTEVYPARDRWSEVAPTLANPARRRLARDPVQPGELLMTVILTPYGPPAEARALAARQGLGAAFPPAGAATYSWYQVDGVGEVVTLAFPVAQLRAVNLGLERFAWKAYQTDFQPTYDFYGPAVETFKLRNRARKAL